MSRYQIGRRVGGRDTIHNIGVDPQLQVMERFGDLMMAARSENIRCLISGDGKEIFLYYHSEVE